MLRTRRKRTFLRDQGGAAAVEFAIIGPLFFVMIIGILFYGGYFWTAHSLQQVANDCARASIAGLDATERAQIARSVMATELSGYPFLEASSAQLTLEDNQNRIAITLSYDASRSPFFSLAGLIPMPPSTIKRQAVVRLGGY